ncbi:hypothetical protein BX661DRAFT_141311 [Kickxella alabastrina]|uniref:uncharacterized protein n=1 Tax=Kickxella alabastrina TaxID=61397 RepID=UPI00221FFD26|nr:uncharacterized protein BX661DRAFT_141311 [Kickxella alabastrina]KAI7832982.1 hypothetical protein BX661DRAFT_141311 [Kickxella alabastrina]
MNGYELAQHVNQYLQDTGHPTRTVAKITQNPERSKHLETATTSVLGLLVDFVNLRSETYNGDSRIPNVAFGTPLEDALRRDITINALFYNIHTREVEDFTGKGLEDLKAGVIRTPLDPFKTFTDDPLRVLRVLRFASRFSYVIDKETSEAMGRTEIKEDLNRKISRERVGVELEKMAGGPHPLLSIQLILRFGLYLDIFRPPPTTTWLDPATTIDEPLAAHLTGHVLDLLERNTEILDCLPGDPRIDADPQAQRSLMLAAYLYPFRHVQVTDRKRNVPVAQVIIRDGLKLANSDIDTTLALHQLADQITQMAESCIKGELSRCQLGLQIRVAGTRWSMAVIFAAAVEMLKSGNGVDARLVDMFGGFVRRVKEENLGEAYSFKHLVDGKAVAKLLGIKPGPGIKDVLDRVMEWQLANPEGTKEQCEVFIREEIAPGILTQNKK